MGTGFRLDEKTHRIVFLSLASVAAALGAWVLGLLLAGPGAGTTVFQNAANLFIIATIVTFVFRGYRPAPVAEAVAANPGWQYETEPAAEAPPTGAGSLSQRIALGPVGVEATSLVPDLDPTQARWTQRGPPAVAQAGDGGSLQDRLEQHLAQREGDNRPLEVADLAEPDLDDGAQGAPDGETDRHDVDPAAELTAWARARAGSAAEGGRGKPSPPSSEPRRATHVEPVRSTPARRLDVHAGDAAAHRPVEKVEYDPAAEAEVPTPPEGPEPGKRPADWESSSTPYIH